MKMELSEIVHSDRAWKKINRICEKALAKTRNIVLRETKADFLQLKQDVYVIDYQKGPVKK